MFTQSYCGIFVIEITSFGGSLIKKIFLKICHAKSVKISKIDKISKMAITRDIIEIEPL